MYSASEVYLTYEIHRHRAEVEKRDRATAPYDHPFVEHVSRVALLIERFRRILTPKPVTSVERETREQPVICLNC